MRLVVFRSGAASTFGPYGMEIITWPHMAGAAYHAHANATVGAMLAGFASHPSTRTYNTNIPYYVRGRAWCRQTP